MEKEVAWLLREKYSNKKSADFFADCARLESGEPLAYIIGYIPFVGASIRLDSKPLIPRPETEYWVEKALTHIKHHATNSKSPLRILDLCAGSGAIGIAIVANEPSVLVDFVEIDPTHTTTIQQSLELNHINPSRTRVFVGDLFSPLLPLTPRPLYDYILCNPPYVDPLLDRTELSVKKYEPHLALYGGKEGLELIERILAEASRFLQHSGMIWIEHEPEHVAPLTQQAMRNNLVVDTHNDQYKVARFSVFTMAQ